MEATGRNARASRLNERLRGAQRVNIADDSFQLDLGAFEAPAPSTSPEADEEEPEPNSSAKRRKLDNGASAPAPRSSPRNPYSLPDTSKESIGQNVVGSAIRAVNAPAPRDPEDDELESLPPPSSIRRSPAVVRNRVVEEIAESPADKPGSGKRRNVQPEGAVASTSRLQSVLRSDDSAAAHSSPTTYKSRQSGGNASVRSMRTVRQTPSRSPQDDIDELSPDGLVEVPSIVEETPTRAVTSQQEPSPEPAVAPINDDLGEATEVGDAEAAKKLRRRPGPRPRVSSPELGSQDQTQEPDEPSHEQEQPRRKRPRPSPAKQKQGGPKARAKPSKPASKTKTTARTKTQAGAKMSPKRKRPASGEDAINLTIQRFVNYKKREGDNANSLQLEIPFANRAGESTVEVFREVCEQTIHGVIAQLESVLESTEDASRKKELRVRIKALEAYKWELNSQLFNHGNHLNYAHSLKKQVRQAQKEKLALREEIIQLKAEREQVALRMDAVRIKHEADTQNSSYLLDTSSTMRDIDLAIAQGREAPDLPAKANKEAELANLELAVAQITDQASSSGPTGGLLGQIKDFNGLLERAALALESR